MEIIGILQKATDAKTQTGIGQEKEIVTIAYNSALAKKVSNGDSTAVTAEDLNTELTNQGATADGIKQITVTFADSKRKYTINNNGIIEYAGTITGETDEGTSKFELTIAGTVVNETTPPNPDVNVFEYKEGTVNTGYVIIDKNNGNEFVWVPVEKNQKINLDIVKEEDITEIKLIDPAGTEINLDLPATIGKKYKNENIEPTYNGEYKAEVTTASGKEEKTLLVRSLYAQDTFNDYSSAKGKAKSEYADTIDFKTSVNTNGGFYIGRYEAGTSVTNRTTKNKSASIETIIAENGIPVLKADQTPYTNITQNQAKGLAESIYPSKTYSSFICTLPTGAAWDRIIGWIINTENGIDISKATYDSSDWGNYSDQSFNVISTAKGAADAKNYSVIANSLKPNSSMLLTTGAAPTRNVANNISDLAGNVLEWTLDSLSRGGRNSGNGLLYPASVRCTDSATRAYVYIGFRPALYLN